MLLSPPVILVAISAPTTPSGTTSITAIGTDQLSYRAASARKTMMKDNPYSMGAWPDEACCSYERPVQSSAVPGGSLAWISSIACIDVPLETPGAGEPWTSSDGRPLYRLS